MPVKVTRGAGPGRPQASALLGRLRASGRDYATWDNGPGDTYTVHTHDYRKHLVCLSGSIRFMLPQTGETVDTVDLAPGDELDLPPGTAHGAIVGPQGVQCAEAHLIGG